MPKQDYGTINFVVYENGKEYLGVAGVKLPDFEYPLFTVSGAGLPGEAEVPVIGQLKPLTTTITFLHANDAASKLSTQEMHELSLWIADEYLNPEKSKIGVDSRKIVMKVMSKKRTGGDLKAATAQEVSGDYSVYYYAEYINNKQVTLFDFFNNKYVDHSGTDRTAAVNKALGKA